MLPDQGIDGQMDTVTKIGSSTHKGVLFYHKAASAPSTTVDIFSIEMISNPTHKLFPHTQMCAVCFAMSRVLDVEGRFVAWTSTGLAWESPNRADVTRSFCPVFFIFFISARVLLVHVHILSTHESWYLLVMPSFHV